MRKIKIITDSCADLNEKLLREYDIDYVQMRTVFEGKETPASLTMTDKEFHDLYNIMRDKKRITTTQVPTEEFITVFGRYLEDGYDIIYIGCSGKSSGSINTGYVVSQKLLESYPDAKIYCIDSLNASIGEGILAIEAVKFVREGFDIDYINDKITLMRKKLNQFVTVHSLDALKRAGRVKGSAAFLCVLAAQK